MRTTSRPTLTARNRTAARWTLGIALLVLVLAIVAWGPGGSAALSSKGAGSTSVAAVHSHPLSLLPLATVTYVFNETGLPVHTFWSVDLNGTTNQTSTNTTLNFTITAPRGTALAYTIIGGLGYSAQPASGTITVGGGGTRIEQIAFLAPGTYGFTFTATGLGFGATAGYLNFNGTNQTFGTGLSRTLTFELTNGSYPFVVTPPAGYLDTATPSSSPIVISGAGGTETVHFTRNPNDFTVTFDETGLPGGVGAPTLWNVTFRGVTQESGGFANNIVFTGVVNGSGYAFSVLPVTGYTAVPSSGSITINGANNVTNIVFVPVGDYVVTFNETGLPTADLPWTVTFNGVMECGGAPFGCTSTTSNIPFTVANGTYAFTVTSPIAGYVAMPATGSVTVSGSAVTQVIEFVPQGSIFTVWFNQTGLPAGQSWTVTLNGVAHNITTVSTSYTEGNGTYAYTITTPDKAVVPTPASGNVIVAGASQTVAVTFGAPPVYTVTFTESGLPSGHEWNVTFNSVTQSSQTTTDVFTGIAAKTYSYSVQAVTGFTLSPSGTQSLTVSNANVGVTVKFTAIAPTTYTVTFSESGLASSTTWSVTLSTSVVVSGATASITSPLTNGSYTYTVNTVTGYTASPTSGSFTVTGAAVSVPSITFTSTSSGGGGGGGGKSSSTSNGLSSSDTDLIVLAVVVILVVAVVAVLMMRRKGPKSPPGGPMEPAMEGGAGAGAVWGGQPEDSGLPPAAEEPAPAPAEAEPAAGAPPESAPAEDGSGAA